MPTAKTPRPESKAAIARRERDDAMTQLASCLVEFSHVTITCVAARDMSRSYRVLVGAADGSVTSITHVVGHACGIRMGEVNGGRCVLRIGGCGFSGELEIAQAIADAIGRKLHQGRDVPMGALGYTEV